MKYKILNFAFCFLWYSAINAFGQTQSEDIIDIRGVIYISTFWSWIGYGILILLAILIIIALFIFIKRYRKKKIAQKTKKAFEIALEQIEKAKEFIDKGLSERFSVGVSEAVRFYIEKRFNIPAKSHTTQEFIRGIVKNTPEDIKDYIDDLQVFLNFCDLAKFACFELSLEQMQNMYKSAKNFVEKTRPIEN
ncbi:MAG: hypothetical protein HQK76_01360 [Desulfobacterales bacterium]|nr:hypothetical protein [Desulfobacterales bacterium]